jgi:hypothetical protein
MAMCLIGSLHAGTLPNAQVSQRIQSLPTLGAPLVGNFYLPDDYAVIKLDKDPAHEYYLGPKDLKDVSAESLRNLNRPLIHVLRANGVKSFQEYIDGIVPETRGRLQRTFELTYPQWGRFQLVSVKMTVGADEVYVAYLPLNDSQGNILLFKLVFPSTLPIGQGNRPSRAELEFWNNFLTKTTL